MKITKNDVLGVVWPKKVPKWALRAAGWDPQSPSKIDWVKYFLIQLSISSKKPPTPGWLGVPKMYLNRKFLIGKAFYPTHVIEVGESNHRLWERLSWPCFEPSGKVGVTGVFGLVKNSILRF